MAVRLAAGAALFGAGLQGFLGGQAAGPELAGRAAKYNGQKIARHLATQTIDPAAKERALAYRNVNTALLFHCGPNIAAKIDGIASNTGQELVRDHGDHFVAWNDATQSYDTLEKIVAKIDPKTKMQVCAAYNVKTNDLSVSFGGTDFASITDLTNAAASVFTGINPRAASAFDATEEIVQAFGERYPHKIPNVNITGHSSGAASVAPAMIVFSHHDFTVNNVDIMAPFGGKKVFDKTADALNIPESVLESPVTSITTGKAGALETLFRNTSATIGNKETCTAEGHMGAHYIRAFNK